VNPFNYNPRAQLISTQDYLMYRLAQMLDECQQMIAENEKILGRRVAPRRDGYGNLVDRRMGELR
jgi:hypothetical protein